MNLQYIVTDESYKVIQKLNWLKDNYNLLDIGVVDDREITRLLENTHRGNVLKLLELINEYGDKSGEIWEKLKTCNDSINLSRILAELYLFIHLYIKINDLVSPLSSTENGKTADLIVKINKLDVIIEVYTPMDFYGYQYFERYLQSTIKYLPIDIGFLINISQKADHLFYTYDFPTYKEIDKWLIQFQHNLIGWLKDANIGDSIEIAGPNDVVLLDIILKDINKDPLVRMVTGGGATRSTDTRLFFEHKDPRTIANTEWGVKIGDKLGRQQAGGPCKRVIRILAINFMLADTSDTNFLCEPMYFAAIEGTVKLLASKISPYPPYDVVVPCDLDFECGFTKPIILSEHSEKFIMNLFAQIDLDAPIPSIPIASKEETGALWQKVVGTQRESKSEK